MKKHWIKKIKVGSGILFTVLLLTYLFIGCFRSTFYHLELIAILFVLVGSALFTGILWLISYKSHPFLTLFFFSISGLFLSILISEHFIRTYKPVLNLHIPEEFEGTIHLFPSDLETSNIYISTYGIGYIPQNKQYKMTVLQGNEDITNALNEAGRGEFIINAIDSFNYETINVICFDIAKNKKYPNTSWNQKHSKCMDLVQFNSLINRGIIDTTKVSGKKWKILSDKD